jgi:peptidoglycan/xylan/chitin deacetylase (PgdA/CDA1 family)
MFSITAYDSGVVLVLIADNRWSIPKRNVSFRIDIDYEIWRIDGFAQDGVASVALHDKTNAAEFMRDLAGGSAVAVYNDDGRRLATFSLNGSSAALAKLAECWTLIQPPSDPFQSTADPF